MWQVDSPVIPLQSKLVSSDPADVATVDNYKAMALRIAKLLDPNSTVPEQHMVNAIAEFVDFEKVLAQVRLSLCL